MMNRRELIRGIAGLAALAVAPGAVASPDDAARFERMAASGRVDGETFYVSRPITLIGSGFAVTNCTFIATADFPKDEPVFVMEGRNSYVTGCIFKIKGRKAGDAAILRIGRVEVGQ